MPIKDIIICLVGESGSGKSTMAELLEKEGYNYIESYTTRKPRYKGEKGHIFINCIKDSADFDILDSVYYPKKNVIAYTFFDNNYYWATREQYKKKGISIYVIDPYGVEKLKETVTDAKIISIYIKTDTNIRIQRMLAREEQLLLQANYSDILAKAFKRIQHDKQKFTAFSCDYIVDGNKNIDTVLENIKKLIKREIKMHEKSCSSNKKRSYNRFFNKRIYPFLSDSII